MNLGRAVIALFSAIYIQILLNIVYKNKLGESLYLYLTVVLYKKKIQKFKNTINSATLINQKTIS